MTPAARREYVKGLVEAHVKKVRDQDGNVWEKKRTLWHHVSGPDFRREWRGRLPSLSDVDGLYGPVLEI